MQRKCSHGYHRNRFVTTHALVYMIYDYKLLVPMNQRVLNKLCKERHIKGHKWSMTHRVLKYHRTKMGVLQIYYAHPVFARFEHLCVSQITLLWFLPNIRLFILLWIYTLINISMGHPKLIYIKKIFFNRYQK